MNRNVGMLLAIAVALVAGCSDGGSDGSTVGYTNVGETQGGGVLDDATGGAADTGTAADTGSGDAAVADAGGGQDASVTDGGAEDGTGGDTGTIDAGPADVASNDATPPDAGPADVASPDAGPVDTGSVTGACAQKIATFAPVAGKASQCQSDLDCYGPASFVDGKGWKFGTEKQLGCACPGLYNGNASETQGVADLVAEYHQAGCPDTCPDVDCDDLSTKIGICKAGVCVAESFSCSELEKRSAEAVAQGRVCSADTECSGFGMQGELPCGCPVNVNLAKMAPGKPIFLYMTKLSQAYVAKGCAEGVQCACPAIGPGVCNAGVCTSK
ncbi:MAG: hypothetical protein RIT45_2430 [Pseudomonadota bacterium]